MERSFGFMEMAWSEALQPCWEKFLAMLRVEGIGANVRSLASFRMLASTQVDGGNGIMTCAAVDCFIISPL